MNKKNLGLASLLVAVALLSSGCPSNDKKTSSSILSTSNSQSTLSSSSNIPDKNLSISDVRAEATITESAGNYITAGVITGKIGNAFFMQDSNAAIFVNAGNIEYTAALGDQVKVKGKIKNVNGLKQFCSVLSVQNLGVGDEIEPLLIASGDFTAAALDNKDSSLVAINDLTYESGIVDIAESESSTIIFKDTSGAPVKLFIDSNLAVEFKELLKTNIDDLIIVDTVTFTGVNLGWNNGPQLIATDEMEIKVIKGEKIDVESVEVSGKNLLKIGEIVTLSATILPEEASVKKVVWSLGEDESQYATLNSSTGELTALKEGIINVVATCDGVISEAYIVEVFYSYGFEEWTGTFGTYLGADSSQLVGGSFIFGSLKWHSPSAALGTLIGKLSTDSKNTGDAADTTSDISSTLGNIVIRMRKDAELELDDYHPGITRFEFDAKVYSASHTKAKVAVYYQVNGSDIWVEAELDKNLTDDIKWGHITAQINQKDVKIKIAAIGYTINLDNFKLYSTDNI